MKTNKIFLIAALLGVTLASCQKEDENNSNYNPELGWRLTVKASKDIDTKALELSGSTLNAFWKEGEKVAVYYGGTILGTLTATVGIPKTSATLTGNIQKPDGLNVGSALMLLFPGRDDEQWTYMGQNGSEPGSELDGFDYSTAALSVSAIDDVNMTITTTAPASFTNEQSVYRFGFKVDGAGEAIAVKSFTITSNRGKLVLDREYSGSKWVSNYGSLTVESSSAPTDNIYYVSLRNENTTEDDTYSISVVASDNALYQGEKTIASSNLINGIFLGAKSLNVSGKKFAPAPAGKEISKEIEVL